MHARNFEKPVHWHRKYRSTRKRQLCRGDKGRRGWYGKRSLEEEKKERKKRKKREKEKRKSQRADRWPAGTKLKGYDATGWAGTTLRGKKGAGMRIGIEGTPVVLAKVIFRLDGLVYFAILWGKISLSCLRRRPLSLSSWLRDHYFGTWLPWTFIRQTFAVVSHPATFLLFSPFFFFFFFILFSNNQDTLLRGRCYVLANSPSISVSRITNVCLPRARCLIRGCARANRRLCLNKHVVGGA